MTDTNETTEYCCEDCGGLGLPSHPCPYSCMNGVPKPDDVFMSGVEYKDFFCTCCQDCTDKRKENI